MELYDLLKKEDKNEMAALYADLPKGEKKEEDMGSKNRNSYDETKDVLIEEVGTFETKRDQRVLVSIRSYDGGRPKICIVREGTDPDKKWTTPKLGRINGVDAEQLAGLLTQASSKLEALKAA